MLQVTRMSPLQFTTATAQPSLASRLTFATPPSAAAPTDADAGGAPNRGKIVIGSVIAVLAVAAITLAATRKSTFIKNAVSRRSPFSPDARLIAWSILTAGGEMANGGQGRSDKYHVEGLMGSHSPWEEFMWDPTDEGMDSPLAMDDDNDIPGRSGRLQKVWRKNAKTPAKKRAYMKGYRAGRKFCG